MSSKFFSRALLCALIALAAPAIHAQAARYNFDLPAQPLADALRAIARQTSKNVLFDPALVEGRSAPALRGNVSLNEAVTRLLVGTPLSIRTVPPDTVVIQHPEKTPGPQLTSGAPADQMRVADNGTDKSRTGTAASEDEGAQVVVEGQRDRVPAFTTPNLDLTRTEDDALPFQVFTAEDIRTSGAPNLQEFLQERLAQNFSVDMPNEADGSFQATGARTNRVDMRGWGTSETIYLLNGRRMANEYSNLSADASGDAVPSFKGIPMASIERIEVLPSAGSAIYGMGATGGVINIITRQDFRGGQLAVNYETPDDVSAPNRTIDMSYGMPIGWGFSLRANASYNDRRPMLARDRADISITRWRQRVMQVEPTRLVNRPTTGATAGNPLYTTSNPYGATPNIRLPTATATDNLFSSIGGPASNFTSVPDGYTGARNLAAFQRGVYNVNQAEAGASSLFLYAADSRLGENYESGTFNLGIDRDFGPNWRLSVEFRYLDTNATGPGLHANRSFNVAPGTTFAGLQRVPALAPNNPFNQAVDVHLVDPYLNREEIYNAHGNKNRGVTTTLRGTVGSWRGFFDAMYSENHNGYYLNSFEEPIGGWYAAFLSGAYNPFVDFRVARAATPAFYENYIARRDNYSNSTFSVSSALKASGPLFSLPAGAVQLTTGAEFSRERRTGAELYAGFFDSVTGALRARFGSTESEPSLGGTPNNTLFTFERQALYGEMSVPLLSKEQGIPLVNRLELTLSARMEELNREGVRTVASVPTPFTYTDTGTLTVVGFNYQIVQGLSLRATRSVGATPPGMSSVTPSTTPTANLNVNDTRRNETYALLPTQYVTGGNPDLQSQETIGTNVGFIVQPKLFPGLRISLDYLEQVRNNAIQTFSTASAIDSEFEVEGLVTRGAPDGNASGLGRITYLDTRNRNLNQIASKSLDISINQRIDNVGPGTLALSVSASRNLSFKVQSTALTAPVENVRNRTITNLARQMAWNGNAQLSYQVQHWTFGWNMRYFDYALATTANFLLQGSDRAPRAYNHDVNFTYRSPAKPNAQGLQQWLLSGTSLTFGVKNLFDRTPRFWAASADRGIVSADALQGRTLWMSMRKDF